VADGLLMRCGAIVGYPMREEDERQLKGFANLSGLVPFRYCSGGWCDPDRPGRGETYRMWPMRVGRRLMFVGNVDGVWRWGFPFRSNAESEFINGQYQMTRHGTLRIVTASGPEIDEGPCGCHPDCEFVITMNDDFADHIDCAEWERDGQGNIIYYYDEWGRPHANCLQEEFVPNADAVVFKDQFNGTIYGWLIDDGCEEDQPYAWPPDRKTPFIPPKVLAEGHQDLEYLAYGDGRMYQGEPYYGLLTIHEQTTWKVLREFEFARCPSEANLNVYQWQNPDPDGIWNGCYIGQNDNHGAIYPFNAGWETIYDGYCSSPSSMVEFFGYSWFARVLILSYYRTERWYVFPDGVPRYHELADDWTADFYYWNKIYRIGACRYSDAGYISPFTEVSTTCQGTPGQLGSPDVPLLRGDVVRSFSDSAYWGMDCDLLYGRTAVVGSVKYEGDD